MKVLVLCIALVCPQQLSFTEVSDCKKSQQAAAWSGAPARQSLRSYRCHAMADHHVLFVLLCGLPAVSTAASARQALYSGCPQFCVHAQPCMQWSVDAACFKQKLCMLGAGIFYSGYVLAGEFAGSDHS
jgi:hypothetical protein